MKKNKFTYSFFLMILVLGANSLYGQPLPELERKLAQIRSSYEQQEKALNSNKEILNQKAAQIDAEKKKANPDKDKIVDLMSHTVSVSNQIDSQQKKLSELGAEIEALKKQLHKRYSAAIDSLNSLKNTRSGNQDDLQAQILLLTEKKLLTAPRISTLSFNPEKILKMNLNEARNDREQNLYREYLQSALSEIDGKIKAVNGSYSEAEEIVYLQKKAGRFLEEAEFQSEIRPNRRSLNGGNVTEPSSMNPDFTKDITTIGNASYYTGILLQLQTITSPSIKPLWLRTGDSRNKNIDVNEYYELLKEVKKNLQEYRAILLHKLDRK